MLVCFLSVNQSPGWAFKHIQHCLLHGCVCSLTGVCPVAGLCLFALTSLSQCPGQCLLPRGPFTESEQRVLHGLPILALYFGSWHQPRWRWPSTGTGLGIKEANPLCPPGWTALLLPCGLACCLASARRKALGDSRAPPMLSHPRGLFQLPSP